MLKLLRWPIRIIAALFAVFVLYVNFKLYDKPFCDPAQKGFVNIDVIKQLHFLKKALHDENAGEEMQLLYPEGYVFIYALYALAWCDVVETLPVESVGWQEGSLVSAARLPSSASKLPSFMKTGNWQGRCMAA